MQNTTQPLHSWEVKLMNRFERMAHELECGKGQQNVDHTFLHEYVMIRLLDQLYQAGRVEYLSSPLQSLNDELQLQIEAISPWLAERIAQRGLFAPRPIAELGTE